MLNPVLPFVIVSFTCTAPAVDLQATSKDPVSCLKRDPSLIFIAQKYGGEDPKGPDPRGDDPNDEKYDKGLPANRDKNIGKAPKDV